MRSKLIVLALAFVIAWFTPLAFAATPPSVLGVTSTALTAAQTPTPDGSMERWLGLGASTDRAGAPPPDETCWLEYRWKDNGCSGCYLKMRMEQQQRLCCQYTGCRAWQNTGAWTCGYVCL